MNREKAEAHWEWTEKLLRLVFEFMIAITHFLYVEAFIHGAKHEREERR